MKIKHLIVPTLGSLLLFVASGCNFNTGQDDSATAIADNAKEKEPPQTILVAADFHPTISPSDERFSQSLEELIMNHSFYIAFVENKFWELHPIYSLEEHRQREYIRNLTNKKEIPESSNLAKAFYIENEGLFILLNEEYYKRIVAQMEEAVDKEEERLQKKKEKDAQSNWDQYLK